MPIFDIHLTFDIDLNFEFWALTFDIPSGLFLENLPRKEKGDGQGNQHS